MKHPTEVLIKDKEYLFITDYKENNTLRQTLNKLTDSVWGFTFENWFESGYWDTNCHLYSLLHQHNMVSHITVTELDLQLSNKRYKAVQLGTVMTDKKYRNRGLCKWLMSTVLKEWESNCDFIFLYANDEVIHFYPQFGFTPVKEYQASRLPNKKLEKLSVRKLNVEETCDLTLLDTISEKAKPLFELSVLNNTSLIMFYCLGLQAFKEHIYYIEKLDTLVIAEYQGTTLLIHDILASTEINIETAIDSLCTEDTELILLQFMPQHRDKYNIQEYTEDDSTLFVSNKQADLFNTQQLLFPTLAHT